MDIFNLIFDFIALVLAKIIARIPASTINLSSYSTVLHQNLGYVNWFIPFYKISQIFTAWSIAFTACVTAFLFIRLALKLKG